MSKISKNIKMLDILSTGKKYTCKQLSDILEISPRMVRLYKDELEKEGIYIDTYYGKNGGYRLRSKLELPSILFNKTDISTLELLIKDTNNEQHIQKLNELKQKIVYYCKLVDNDIDFLDDCKKEMLYNIQNSIEKHDSIKIEYFSKGNLKDRIVYPKQIYMYDKLIMIIVQYSEDKNDLRHIKLDRINKIINK